MDKISQKILFSRVGPSGHDSLHVLNTQKYRTVLVPLSAMAPARLLNENCTGLAQMVRLGPTFLLKIPIRALKLGQNLGQPYTVFVHGTWRAMHGCRVKTGSKTRVA